VSESEEEEEEEEETREEDAEAYMEEQQARLEQEKEAILNNMNMRQAVCTHTVIYLHSCPRHTVLFNWLCRPFKEEAILRDRFVCPPGRPSVGHENLNLAITLSFLCPLPFEEWRRGIKCYPCLCVRLSVRPLSKFGVRSIT